MCLCDCGVWVYDHVCVVIRGLLSGVGSIFITMVPGVELRSFLLPETSCCPLLILLKKKKNHHEAYTWFLKAHILCDGLIKNTE